MNTQKRSLECQRSGCNCYLKNIPHKKNSKRTSPIKSSKTHASMRIKSTITQIEAISISIEIISIPINIGFDTT